MAQTAIAMPEKLGTVKVLAAESTRMNSQLLAEALAQDSRLEVAAIEPDQALILAAVAQQRPDVVLISTALEESGTQGFDLARQISASYPETQLILLMDSFNPAFVVQAFRAGAHGIFSRTESSKGLAKCIHSVHQGQVWANSAELRCVVEALRESEPMQLVDSGGDAILSKREQDVVRCVAEGLSNREIAGRLGLTEHTVKNYLFRIFDKLGVSSRVEVVLYVYRFRKEWAGTSTNRTNITSALGPKLLTKPANRMRSVPPAVVAGN
jgi:DNA-binding NarL/FixJ family response regulator